MNSKWIPPLDRLTVLLALVGVFGWIQPARALTTIISNSPADGATDVSPATIVVFTFSGPMDPNASGAVFLDSTFTTPYPAFQSWSAGNTILTCTPLAAFPADELINWFMQGNDANGDPLEGIGFVSGSFTTGPGGGGGNGTNAITTFSVGKVHHYNQTSAGPATPDPLTPYGFSGVTALSSNRTATSVALTTPTTAVYDLFHLPPPSAEKFILATNFTSLSSYDAAFPAGNYNFFVQAATSNQTVNVNLPTPASQPQPGVPHLTNYLAAQNVNPSEAFVLGWDVFPDGTAADYIDVDIDGATNSPNPGLPGALTGTARTFTIPAGTLQPNSTYLSRVGFFRHVGTTNADHATAAYRATYTEFNLVTGSSGPASLVLTNAAFNAGNFTFNVLCTNLQTVMVEYRTNLAIGPWQTLLTTNNPPNRFAAVAPQAATNRLLFFRARNGP